MIDPLFKLMEMPDEHIHCYQYFVTNFNQLQLRVDS